MKSKKLMGLLLAGALLVGATGAGSYAYFTDAVSTDANLTVAMGNLDIEIEEPAADEQWWVKAPTESWDEDFAPTDWYSNVRPGDQFTRTVKVTNAGSLAAKLDVAIADIAATEVAPGV
ncbi:SipW-dependent-type signal peptide-containing protein, partial [Clostridium sp.]|uniref:SipW-dependent-type signal peptide-containing protein n=1 Tax=Clostridium sp. TaxID=1506 RepID=UPI003F411C72